MPVGMTGISTQRSPEEGLGQASVFGKFVLNLDRNGAGEGGEAGAKLQCQGLEPKPLTPCSQSNSQLRRMQKLLIAPPRRRPWSICCLSWSVLKL